MILTQEIVNDLLWYNPFDGSLTWKERPRKYFNSHNAFASWNARYAGEKALCTVNHNGYCHGRIFGKGYLAHRVIWFLLTGVWPIEIDHDNRNRSDNRLCNLKNVARPMNGKNLSRKSNNISGVNGVHWETANQCWRAGIMVDGKTISLGRFQKKSEAENARKHADKKYNFHSGHGDKLATSIH